MTRWSNEDALVVLADLAYIAGSIRGDKQLLLQALAAYDACYFCLDRVPTSGNVMHMRAETLYCGCSGRQLRATPLRACMHTRLALRTPNLMLPRFA